MRYPPPRKPDQAERNQASRAFQSPPVKTMSEYLDPIKTIADIERIMSAIENMPNNIAHFRQLSRKDRDDLMDGLLNLVGALTMSYETVGNCAPEIDRGGMSGNKYAASVVARLLKHMDALREELCDTLERGLELD